MYNIFDYLMFDYPFLNSLANVKDTEKLDFTKKEDVDKLDDAISNLKSSNVLPWLFGDNSFLDNLKAEAHKIYDEAEAERLKKEAEAERLKKEAKAEKPSSRLSTDMKKSIASLVVEYMNTMIIPNYKDMTEEQAKSVSDALYEFACWIYNR